MSITKTGYFINCENCGKEIYQTKTQYNRAKHHFCSNKCQKEFQHNQLFEDRQCEICGEVFNVNKKSEQRFCSTKCQGRWQSTQIGDLNPRTNRIICNCDNCGNELKIIKSIYNRNKYNFCNESCRKEWYSNYYSKQKEWIDESRKRAVNILKNNNTTTNTLPQKIINELLLKMGIKYENEKEYTYYSVDNYLIDYNLIIEVMGDFWHCNPNIYNTEDKIRDIQKRRIPKDKSKHTYIKNKYNIEILYLWENDIYNNLELCEQLIRLYVLNNGILQNYHSFNYNIENGDIELNNKIIIPYQDLKIS